jgi:hypothetical protein
MEGMKNKPASKTKEGLANKPASKTKEPLANKHASKLGSKEGFANIEGSNNPSIFSMLFFKDTKFKPQCCPSSYSNSMGCACIKNSQYKYLIERGGNNVPFSEY